MTADLLPIETHPLEPFVPATGRILFLGSFPPPRAKWSMEFFYPNFINDFWRIMGVIFYADRHHFEVAGERRFDQAAVEAFALERGLAFYDTARRVRRLKGNASDAHLEVVEATNIAQLLAPMPHCHRIVTTGGKASATLLEALGATQLPDIGTCIHCPAEQHALGRDLEFWRMPSSSRAYPLALDKKAEFYRRLFEE
ncbi:MAG: uracil-DNA glycosylase family protein [Bacteroidaceae bacterium]|nr:uracil-DNA glycosylase family protein [Bacteroidaceae bacterium]